MKLYFIYMFTYIIVMFQLDYDNKLSENLWPAEYVDFS